MYENVPRTKEAVRLLWGEEDIVPPGAILFNDRAEFYWAKRERLWAFISAIGAGAARPMIACSNDAPIVGGNLIIVVEVVKIIQSPAGLYQLSIDAAQGLTPTANLSRDPRNLGVQSKNRQRADLAFSGNQIDQHFGTAAVDAAKFDALPVVLNPGHSLAVFGVNATPMTVVMKGYEYNARAEELSV